jgi:hypothetical protein
VKKALGSKETVTIADISNMSGRDALLSIKESASIADVLAMLKNVQRVVVIKETGGSNQFVGVISQVCVSIFNALVDYCGFLDLALWASRYPACNWALGERRKDHCGDWACRGICCLHLSG